MKLNLGCGLDLRHGEGWVNVDLSPPCNVVADVTALPFKEASVDEVFAAHVLEHVVDLVKVQRELARVMKPRGILQMVVPSYSSPDAWGDPTHVRAFSKMSFLPDYWAGFSLAQIEGRTIVKRFHATECLWLWVVMVRSEMPYWQIARVAKFQKSGCCGAGGSHVTKKSDDKCAEQPGLQVESHDGPSDRDDVCKPRLCY